MQTDKPKLTALDEAKAFASRQKAKTRAINRLAAQTDLETMPAREKLAQFELTDAQRLAFMTEERDQLLAELKTIRNRAAEVIARVHNGRLAK